MRLFVAVDLPDDIKQQLETFCQGVPGARWVPPENMHITLRFIGEVGGDVQDDIARELRRVRAQPFELTLAGSGHFESGRHPRALWIGVSRSEPLHRLRDAVGAAVQRAGLPPEGRKYRPHVTLARLKVAPEGRVQSFLSQHSLYRSRPFTVEGFTLFSSLLSRNGAIYRAEAEFPFSEGGLEEAEEDWSTFDPWGAGTGEAEPR